MNLNLILESTLRLNPGMIKLVSFNHSNKNHITDGKMAGQKEILVLYFELD